MSVLKHEWEAKMRYKSSSLVGSIPAEKREGAAKTETKSTSHGDKHESKAEKKNGLFPASSSNLVSNKSSNTIWRSKRLVYRALEAEDTHFMDTMFSPEDRTKPDISVPRPPAPSTPEQWTNKDDVGLITVMICLSRQVDNSSEEHFEPVGYIGLAKVEEDAQRHRSTWLGIGIATRHQSNGYGTEALCWMLDWGFRHANLHRIYLEMSGWNTGALRVYERVGFHLDGRHRQSRWYKGQWHDGLEMSILRHEWEAKRQVQSKSVAGWKSLDDHEQKAVNEEEKTGLPDSEHGSETKSNSRASLPDITKFLTTKRHGAKAEADTKPQTLTASKELSGKRSNTIWRSERLVYRAWEAEDAEFYNTMFSPEDRIQTLFEVLSPPVPMTGEMWLAQVDGGVGLAVMICLPVSAGSDKLETVGYIGLEQSEEGSQHRKFELGIGIATRHQRKGYGTEAVKWGLNWGFNHANANRISLQVHSWNDGAVRMYERLGFTTDVRSRNLAFYRGQYHDTLEMSILRHEWKGIKGTARLSPLNGRILRIQSSNTIWGSKRLVYRALEDEDTALLRAIYANADDWLQTTDEVGTPRSENSAARTVARFRTGLPTAAICLRDEAHTPIGYIGMPPIGGELQHHRTVYLGLGIQRRYQNHGYGTEAILWCLEFGFRQRNLNRILLQVVEYNMAAMRLYQRLGFVVEVREREAIWSRGRFWDLYEMSMLRTEWELRYSGGDVGAPKGEVNCGLEDEGWNTVEAEDEFTMV